jgi:hypothetical protein
MMEPEMARIAEPLSVRALKGAVRILAGTPWSTRSQMPFLHMLSVKSHHYR